MNKININYVQDKYILEFNKKNKDEHLIFLSTAFQLNLIKETDILFFDRTFHSCHKSFYQVFNIVCHLKNKNICLPLVSVIIKYKYELSYINLFD